MYSEQKQNRMVCGSCKHVFDYKDAAIVYRKMYGIDIPEKKCPLCGGTFRAVEVPDDLDSLLYVDRDERYYSYPDNNKSLN